MLCFLLQEKAVLWIIGDKPDLLSFAGQLGPFFSERQVGPLDVLAVGDPTPVIADFYESMNPFEKITLHLDEEKSSRFLYDIPAKTISYFGPLEGIEELRRDLIFLVDSEGLFENKHLFPWDCWEETPYPENLIQKVNIYINRSEVNE